MFLLSVPRLVVVLLIVGLTIFNLATTFSVNIEGGCHQNTVAGASLVFFLFFFSVSLAIIVSLGMHFGGLFVGLIQ